MSKKTNVEKQKRRAYPRRHLRRPKGVRGKRVNMADFPPMAMLDCVGGVIDIALGTMFVKALRDTGLRDKIVDMVFGPVDENSACEGAD